MKVILNHDISKVGKKYEVKDVADGYALNFLIPKGLAETATPKAMKRLDGLKAVLTAERKVQEDLLAKNIKSIDGVRLEMEEKANDKGHLFAGLHTDQIVPALKKQTGIDVLPEFILLEKPIKEVGEHSIEVKVGDKSAKFTLVITAA